MLAIKHQCILLHASLGDFLLCVDCQLPERPFNLHFLVYTHYALVHLLLALSNLLISAQSRVCDFEKPLFADGALDLIFERLEYDSLLAKCEPVTVHALTQDPICSLLQVFLLKP